MKIKNINQSDFIELNSEKMKFLCVPSCFVETISKILLQIKFLKKHYLKKKRSVVYKISYS